MNDPKLQSRSKQDDAELAVLKEKAKQMQQEELEQMQKRAANQTALLAIGQKKKPKIDVCLYLSVNLESSCDRLLSVVGQFGWIRCLFFDQPSWQCIC